MATESDAIAASPSERLARDGLDARDAVDGEGEGAVVRIAEGEGSLSHDAPRNAACVERRLVGRRSAGGVERAREDIGGAPRAAGQHVPGAASRCIVRVPDTEDVARGVLHDVEPPARLRVATPPEVGV